MGRHKERVQRPKVGALPTNKRAPGKPAKISSLKNQIRSFQRLLRKEGVDPKVKASGQRTIERLEEQRRVISRAELEKKLCRRYKKVKFTERVKIERSLRQIEAKLEKTAVEPTRQELQAQLQRLRADLQYVKHFPKGEVYVSVLRSAENPEAEAELEAKRTRLRLLVEAQLAEEARLAEADEGRSKQQPPRSPTERVALQAEVAAKEELSDPGDEQTPASGQQSRSKSKAKRAKVASQGGEVPRTGLPLPEATAALLSTGMADEDDFFLTTDAQATGRADASEPSTREEPKQSEVKPRIKGKNRKALQSSAQRTPKRHSSAGSGTSDTKGLLRTRAEGGRKRRKKKG